jgi:hypothetical protein
MELQDIIRRELDELETLADMVAKIMRLQDIIQQNSLSLLPSLQKIESYALNPYGRSIQVN